MRIFGASITADGATVHGEPIANFALKVASMPKPVHLKILNAKKHIQCAKQPACLGLNTERSVHRTGLALFMPWSDAPGLLSAHTLVVRSVGQEDGSPQWGAVHEQGKIPK